MQDFFERKVFRSGNGGSEYDPQTYTLRFAGPYPGVPFVNRLFHELIHWMQHICYTFGGFQSASIHMRDELAKQVLIKYAKSKVDYQRHQVQFSLPESRAFFNSYFDHEGIEQNIWMHQHAWRDQLICENLFLQMSECYEDGKGYKGISSVHEILQPELLIPRTLLRINNWAIGTLGYSSIEPRGPLEITNFANHPKLINFGRASHAGIELDTRDIIEGMAVAFEMYSIRMEADAKKRLEEILETPVSEYYVRAVKIFLEIMGFSLRHDNVARMAMMFLAIAEMSLDPPLPPFGIINKLELDWNKIYPPLRFIQLCHTVRDVVGTSGYIIDPRIYNWILDREGKVGPEPSHYLIGSHLYSWLFDWIANVEALYLSHGGVFSYLSRDKDGYLSNEKSVPFLALIAEKNPDMRDILRHKGVNTISRFGLARSFGGVPS